MGSGLGSFMARSDPLSRDLNDVDKEMIWNYMDNIDPEGPGKLNLYDVLNNVGLAADIPETRQHIIDYFIDGDETGDFCLNHEEFLDFLEDLQTNAHVSALMCE